MNSQIEILRKYINIINENQNFDEEILSEGMLQKLAGFALGTVLALGPKVGQAETVFSYLDPNTNQMQTVLDMSKVPAAAKVVMAVDTDTNQVMVLKGGPTDKPIQPDPKSLNQAQNSNDQSVSPNSEPKSAAQNNILTGEYSIGMSYEDVLKLSKGKPIKGIGSGLVFRGGGDGLKGTGKISDKDSVKIKAEGTPFGKGETFFQFDSNNQLVGVHYVANVGSLGADKNLKSISKGAGLFGFPMDDLGRVFGNAYEAAKNITGPLTSKPKLRSGTLSIGGLTVGVAGVTSGGSGIGVGIPMDKSGDGTIIANTSKGYFAMGILTQSGMVNSFRPIEIVAGFMAPGAEPAEIEIDK